MNCCNPEDFAKQITSPLCGSIADATRKCAAFNKAVEDQLPGRERIKTALVKLLYAHVPCEGPSWQEGGCPDRVHGNCGEFGKLSPCVAEHLAEYLIANSVTIEECNRDCANCIKTKLVNPVQKWIPVTEGMPEERNSVVPGLGTVSKPVLVTWLDPTSDKQYPDNCFVREGITRNGEFTLTHINGDLIPVAWMPQPEPYEPPKEVTDGRSDC